LALNRTISRTQISALFYVFAALDAATFILNFNWFFPPSFLLMSESFFYLMVIVFVFSLPISGYFNIQHKQIALWIYYFHFPIRLATTQFSFSFIIQIDRSQLGSGPVYSNLFYLFIFLEVLRLVATIFLHRQLRRPEATSPEDRSDILDLE